MASCLIRSDSDENCDILSLFNSDNQLPAAKNPTELKVAALNFFEKVWSNDKVYPLSDLRPGVSPQDDLYQTQLIYAKIQRCHPTICTSIAHFEENRLKNRYADIAPYNENRVVVTERSGQESYINASPLVLAGRTFIAAQAPTFSTTNTFLKMINLFGVRIIITLSMAYEKNKEGRLVEKGYMYWPNLQTEETEEDVLESEGEESLVCRTLTLEGKQVVQLHYYNWPDHGAPNPRIFQRLINECIELNELMVVHCSAGVGRTATLIGALSLILENHPIDQVPLEQRIEEMRHYRPQMVQSVEQVGAIKTAVRLHHTSQSTFQPGR